MTEPLDLHDDHVLITGTEVARMPGGSTFWDRLFSDDAFRDRVGDGWLVAAYDTASDWDSWEMHPHADEVVHVTSGQLEIILDRDGNHERLVAPAGTTVIVPAGVWHTIDVGEPGGTLNITHGEGTQHRPR